ncbi:MAG: malto-oligosyltrehalose trehalohydrolase [Acidobacteriota bacterium]|nr:malto-oligosyltrehalose trehalohydrolase [Acidobacteriota bacterium]
MSTSIQEQPISSTPRHTAPARAHTMPFGAQVQDDGSVRFALWAPGVEHVTLAIEGPREILLPLQRDPHGFFSLTTRSARVGSRYRFVLPDGMRVPDPASRFQPEDIHGPSEVIDPAAFPWQDTPWRGRPWNEAVVYELHLGTFTAAGTFQAAIARLDHLVQLGVSAVQIMPVADFPGSRNWGYDGALLFAPDSSYGRPEDFKAFVEAAHARGIGVILDVVYNHFGPDGNYLPLYAPQTFTQRHKTPWGDAVNFDDEGSDTVRRFVLDNTLYWLEEFHLDGLRFDAVHQIRDDTGTHILDQIAHTIRSRDWGRPIHLILENEKNEASRLLRNALQDPEEYTAQWNDDMHHVLHVAATMESHGYYGDYVEDTGKLGRALAEGFAFQGQHMTCAGAERGEPSAHLPPTAFVAFMQNHDQVGNRAFGDRIHAIASPEAVHAIAAIYLLLPQIPMLFMGEEWGTTRPFPFFCDFQGELRELVREGRRAEFASFPEFQDPHMRDRIPDPGAPETFLSGKLDWNEISAPEHAHWLDWYTRILAVRRQKLVPLIPQIGGNAGTFRVLGPGSVCIRWQVDSSMELALTANLCTRTIDDVPDPIGETLWQQGAEQQGGRMAPWSVRWSLQHQPTPLSVPGHALRCGPETSVTSPLRRP